MVTDAQVRKLWKWLAAGKMLALTARKTGMDEKTARKYRDAQSLPSQMKTNRAWRTRADPFTDVWPDVQERLENEPRLRAFTLFGWLQDHYPGRFLDSQRRTFERRVRHWRGTYGPDQEVIFPQVHDPGGLGASDFTSMNAIGITIAGQRFEHMLYHFTLTYSNWESISICFSESFESLSRGLQQAFWELGGAPRKHRTDSLSAAVNNLSEDREFRKRYRDLMDYYQVEPQRINVRKANENGDIESSHGHLKTVVEQALLLRGSRDFASRAEYEQFLEQLTGKRNTARGDKFAEEQQALADLPPGKLDHVARVCGIKVRSSSTIQVKRNTYSVHSRLIGHKVDVVIDVDFIEVWHAGVAVGRMPRLTGSGKHAINYRHVIDSLVRKPGAFENYQYREDMFPTSHFRIAYDWLCEHHRSRVAVREYLKILQLAARDSQDAVQDALRLAIEDNLPISSKSVRLAVEQHQLAPPVTEINIEPPDLKEFDSLLQYPDMEVDCHEFSSDENGPSQDAENASLAAPEANELFDVEQAGPGEQPTDAAVSRASAADVPRTLPDVSRASGHRITESHGVSCGTDGPGMSDTPRESDCPSDDTISTDSLEDLGQFRLEASANSGDPSDRESPRWDVSGSSREPFAVRQARLGQITLSLCAGGAARAARPLGVVHDLQLVGAATSDRQTGLATAEIDQEVVEFRRPDYRRPGLCTTKPRGDGSALYAFGRTVRTGQCNADQQLAVQQVGTDLQRRHDDGGRHRSISASQRDPGVERAQLPIGERQESQTEVPFQQSRYQTEINDAILNGVLIVANAEL